ncbi:unnamed protein product, partial [Discosporangium mesarthrocarpum]
LKVELWNSLATRLYREVVDFPEGRRTIPALIKAVCKAFISTNDLRQESCPPPHPCCPRREHIQSQVVRHCDRLFPPDLRAAVNTTQAAERVRSRFVQLRRENLRKRLSSELELKMRALYYDRIDPTAVEGLISSIYQQVELLEDIQFLIKHAKKVFPPQAGDITGVGVRDGILALQAEMTAARERCVEGLFQALQGLYPDCEPPLVRGLTARVAAAFSGGRRFASSTELEEMKQLAADAQVLS